ncbi:amidohydrolase [Agromyces archimandritae]|uniref:Amidohydrolase n=2 Tax=Agromyces archimandritae TaxID=2781962 RepID=A0A975FS92_9MICO|nr:amidohydrolase [Agromyces archimandritae]
MTPTSTLLAEARAILPGLQLLRRELHADPEVGLELPRTQRRVLDALDGLGLEITTGRATTSVVAVLRGGRPGPTVLLRGDMDALPVAEEADVPYRSTNGAMHACGHDLHTAGLVGAARLLAARREELAGDVLFMFQPGEESWGGAKIMLDEGLLDASGSLPVAAYALHVEPGPRGLFRARPGATMASSNSFYATLHGRGGHASTPWKSVDPLPALAELALALGSLVGRRVDVFDPAVLSVTMLRGSRARNIIAENAELGSTVRTLSDAAIDVIEREAVRLADGIAAAHGLVAESRFTRHYPTTVNDAAAVDAVREAVTGVLGAGAFAPLPNPWMGAEDFSFVLERVPGAFVIVGASPDGVDAETSPSNHSPQVVFDDRVLAEQAAVLAGLALRRLG